MSLKFSQDLKLLLEKLANEPITVAQIFQFTGDRGISLIISLLILPFLFPMPPGAASVMGISSFCLAIQMGLGRKSPWLPKSVAQFKFPRSLSQQLLKNLGRIINWLEKIVRSRWSSIATNHYATRVNGFCIAWLSILLMLPVPLTNPFPTVAILLLTIATLETDGLLMSIGYFFTLINTILFTFIGYALWQAPQLLPKFLSIYSMVNSQ